MAYISKSVKVSPSFIWTIPVKLTSALIASPPVIPTWTSISWATAWGISTLSLLLGDPSSKRNVSPACNFIDIRRSSSNIFTVLSLFTEWIEPELTLAISAIIFSSVSTSLSLIDVKVKNADDEPLLIVIILLSILVRFVIL